jgi:hypothetical protein
MKYIIRIILLTSLMPLSLHAQPAGELENVEIEIVKERKITMPEAERKFSKITPHASEPISPPITYSFSPVQLDLPLANLSVKPLKLKKETEENAQRGYFSAGYGNYASPYLEGYVTSRQNTNLLLGAHGMIDVWSKGPVDKKNSGNGLYGASLFAHSYGEKVTASANLGYHQSFWHFYGYPASVEPDAEDILQRFNRFSLGGSLANATAGKADYKLKANFGFLSDKFDARETKVDLDLEAGYQVGEHQRLTFSTAYQIISREDAGIDAKPRSLLSVNGLYSFEPLENLKISAGVGIAYENDTIDKDFHVYPHLKAIYALSEKVRAKAHLTGQMQSVSLHSMTNENPWLAPAMAIAHTNEALSIGGGIEASVASNVVLEAGIAIASLRNLYFYFNDPTDQAKFITQFDKGATERTNFFAGFSYSLAQKTSVVIRADWFGYNTDTLAHAWHRPTHKVLFEASHNFYKKLKLTGSFITLGGMKAYNTTEVKTVTLDAALDLSLRADYFLSEKFLVFLQTANVLGNDYNLYLNYPVRGFQVRAGVSWSF